VKRNENEIGKDLEVETEIEVDLLERIEKMQF